MNTDCYDGFMGYITDEGMQAWLGGTNINYAVPDFDMDPPWYDGQFQRSLEHGDFNSDGYDDIAIAASHEYNPWLSGNFNGYVWVFGGNAQLEDTTIASDDPTIPGISGNLLMKC